MRLGAYSATVQVDPATQGRVDTGGAVVNGQAAGPAAVITGEAPPQGKRSWWPWILGAAALAGLWWMVKDEEKEEGSRVERPFVG